MARSTRKKNPPNPPRRATPAAAPDLTPRVAWWPLVAIALAAFAVFMNGFSGAFLLDDIQSIVDNADIHNFQLSLRGRPVVALTLALNYKFGGLDPWGYHVVNVIIHAAAGLVLYGIVRRVLERDRFRDAFVGRSTWIAFAIALLWVVHPLQTQSVTYIIQRGESLMGLFYLLTVYFVLRGSDSSRPWPWYAGALGACLVGMGAKPIILTAPIVILLFDASILTGSLRRSLRARWGVYVGLVGTWLALLITGIISTIFFSKESSANSAGFAISDLTAWEYFLTQPLVILHYLRLSVWPHPLCLDYWWPISETPLEIIVPGLIVTGLAAGTAWALWRRPWLGFLGAWFFVILGPTSSIVPLRDIAFEHRMYLPLATIVVLVVLGGDRLIRTLAARWRWSTPIASGVAVGLLFVVAAALGATSIDRNRDYETPLRMWQDVVEKNPLNPRAHTNLCLHLTNAGRFEEAIEHGREAVRLDPKFAPSRAKLVDALRRAGRDKEATSAFIDAILLRAETTGFDKMDPVRTVSEDEFADVQELVRTQPDDLAARRRLARMLEQRGDTSAAVEGYLEIQRREGDSKQAHADLARALMAAARPGDAIEHLVALLRFEPNPATQQRLAIALALHGDIDATIAPYTAAVDLTQAHARAHTIAGDRLAAEGKRDAAAASYRRALEIDPDQAHATMQLRNLLGAASP